MTLGGALVKALEMLANGASRVAYDTPTGLVTAYKMSNDDYRFDIKFKK